MEEDKKIGENLDNTIEEFFNVLQKHRNDSEEMEEAYQRIESLRARRKV